ncbi:WD40-repeat-containing domain protein, partial [Dichotomocladium elegans]
LVTCSSTGHVSYTSLSDYNTANTNVTTTIFSVPGSDLSIMRVHPIHSNIFATGGKANDLKVFDANMIMQHKDSAPTESSNTKKSKKDKAIPGLLFQAKNVRPDMLDLEVPIWIRDLQFVNDKGTKIATATHYHQIRLYDTEGQQRRPVRDVDVGGKVPLTCLRVGKDPNQLVYTDTMNTMRFLDLTTGRPLAQFKGLTGAATDVALTSGKNPEDTMLVSVSVDRFLRVHETKTTERKCEHSIYLKQRLTCVLIDEDRAEEDEEEEEEDEEEQAMWEAMETVDDKTDHPKKRKHSTA